MQLSDCRQGDVVLIGYNRLHYIGCVAYKLVSIGERSRLFPVMWIDGRFQPIQGEPVYHPPEREVTLIEKGIRWTARN